MKTNTYKNNWIKSLMSYKVQWMLGVAFMISCGFACEEDLPGVGDIEDVTPPVAVFESEVSKDDYFVVDFTNSSESSTDFIWDFGDGEYSTDEHPQHTYAELGTYRVILKSLDKNDAEDTTSQELIIAVPPTASFTYAKDNSGDETYNFTNTSTDAISFKWDFGNGIKSEEENPSVTYTSNGEFTVRLVVTNSAGVTDDESVLIVIGASTPVLVNPDFEIKDFPTESSGSTCNCWGWVNNTVGKQPQTTGDTYEGSGAIKMPSDGTRVAYQEVAITPGYNYSFDFYYSGNIVDNGSLVVRILNAPLTGDVSTITEDMILAEGSFLGSGATKTYDLANLSFNSGASSTIAVVITGSGTDYRVDNTGISIVY